MAFSRVACLKHLGTATKGLLLPKRKVEMSAALNRFISSDGKKPSVWGNLSVDPPNEIANPPRTPEDFVEVVKKPRNWISYGFDYHDKDEDSDFYHLTMFWFFSCFVVFGAVFLTYLPDFRREDWCLREAYLELARREKYGLPLVDREFIPLDRIRLPTEEWLEENGQEVFL